MPRQRSKKLSEGRKAIQQPTPPTQDEREQDDSENESLDMIEKDEDEAELDRLVLGDGAAFMAHLDEEMQDEGEDASEAELEAEVGLDDEEENLEEVDDADVGDCCVYKGLLHSNQDISYSSWTMRRRQSMVML
jgi:U3 small nucleolar RNA-associated protein 18